MLDTILRIDNFKKNMQVCNKIQSCQKNRYIVTFSYRKHDKFYKGYFLPPEKFVPKIIAQLRVKLRSSAYLRIIARNILD
jgi:hypothetical protein